MLMENIDPALIQQFFEQYRSTSGNENSMSPTINVFPQEFIALLSTLLIATVVLSSLFLLFYIIGTIRKWKVQSAVLDMHRDVKELKAELASSKPTHIERKI